MYDIIPIILILISLSVIIIVIVRKFPVLANIDIRNMPAEKEGRFKERIIGERLKRGFIKWRSKITRAIRPAGEAINSLFKLIHNKLHELKERYKKEIILSDGGSVSAKQKIEQLFKEAEELSARDESKAAEKKLIEIISLDHKNVEAFKMLGRLYFKDKNYNNAKQTLKHVLKLAGDDSEIYFSTASICEAQGDFGGAINNINKALDLEPNNPRYLDTKLEISIIKKDKTGAREAYEKLKEVNPENQKLEEFEEQIKSLD
ncbi:hypothetical protein HY798_03795 [Candidatus Falkowbacteria bacterium]|nr:hypothetical protein [Candidatus Falkowbacteria bacterium]